MPKVIILGAKGRFGRAATTAFVQAGWTVTALARSWDQTPPAGVTAVTGDAADLTVLTQACAGQDVIVNAVNLAYELWAKALPGLTASVVSAAQATGATVLLPGNVYNYGADAPELLSETTPWHPTTRKGALRVTMERAYRDAGVRTIVLRGGDFLEQEKSGNWFDAQIAVKAHRGKTMYPGPTDRIHAWAYLPDMARAAVMLAEQRDSFAPFEEFGFDGYALTGEELVQAITRATGKAQKVSGLPWWIVPVMGLFNPTMREVYEMRYLWSVRHRLDGRKLAKAIPDFRATPLDQAFADMLAA